MNDSTVSSPTRDRIPLTPIIEGGVAPKILTLSTQGKLKDGTLESQRGNRYIHVDFATLNAS